MPFPVAHSLAGASLYAGLDRDGGSRWSWRLVAAVFLANAPDLDLVPGLLVGDPNRFHHGWTHSFFTAAAIGLVAAWLCRRRPGWPAIPALGGGAVATGVIVALLWGSHVALDILTEDARAPFGVPALWPLSDERLYVGWPFVRAERLAGPGSPAEFLSSMLTGRNFRTLAREAMILAPVLAALLYWRRAGKR